MAGGTGTRLYPASRSHRPKQFLSLGDDRSLLARTVERASFADEVYVCTTEEHADDVRERVPEAGVLVEPEPKDTGPALVYAAHRIRELRRATHDGNANGDSRELRRATRDESGSGDDSDPVAYDEADGCVLLCLPSDHRIAEEFEQSAKRAARAAVETEGLTTFGVEPTRPATGYGYVEPGEARDGYFEVREFREKPDRETAERFVEEGFYWNAGLFAWTPDALLREARDSPLSPLVDALDVGDPERGFAAVDALSIDHAVMERTDDAYAVPAGFEWDDLGSWDALRRLGEADADGNVVLGDALTVDAGENVIASDEAHVTVVGGDDLVVAAYDDRVLVVPVDEAQRVREAVSELRERDEF